jgi:glycosyltransferase involved in cell wall biosynthesis
MTRLSNLRILMTADAVGGVWTYATGLASALAERGADVHLVTMGPAPNSDQRAMISAASVHVVETPLALEWQDPEGNDVAAARRFFNKLEAHLEPDIVHLNSFREAAFGWQRPVVVAAHSCVNSWAIACQDAAWLSNAQWQSYTKSLAAGLHGASAWVCPSHAFHDTVADLYRPRSPGFVIWNGIAPAAARPGQKEDFILAAGRMWDTAKNLSALAHAGNGQAWPILVAGSDGTSARGGPAVQLLGQVPHADVLGLMRRAAIFTSPARYEPFGLSVLEAASAGCALVLSDIPTFRELWDEAALFVDQTDVIALHRALSELATDAGKRTLLQQAAFARSRLYASRRMVDSYVALYQGLLASNAKLAPAPAVEVPI